jgi:hypothetical protein
LKEKSGAMISPVLREFTEADVSRILKAIISAILVHSTLSAMAFATSGEEPGTTGMQVKKHRVRHIRSANIGLNMNRDRICVPVLVLLMMNGRMA